jgi:putrescine transport system permease protein
VLFDIMLPVISPAIASGWLLAFTTGPGSTTLPLLIWSKVKLGVAPDINAPATLMVLTVGACVILAGVILSRAEKHRLADARMALRKND